MRVLTDVHSINLSTGERTRQWVGDGQRCDCIEHQRLGPRHHDPTPEEIRERSDELVKIVEAARRALQKEQQMVRGKFTLQSIAKVSWSPTAQVFKFGAVHDTVTEENSRFAKYTPSGQLEMTVDNPPAQEFFELGKNYYLDFSKAE